MLRKAFVCIIMPTQSTTDVAYHNENEVHPDVDEEQQIPFLLHEEGADATNSSSSTGSSTGGPAKKSPTAACCFTILFRRHPTAVAWAILCLSIVFLVSGAARDRSLEARCIRKMNGWCKSSKCFCFLSTLFFYLFSFFFSPVCK